jgi:uncharacterized protein GlcG (DUF336 family)
MKFISLATGLIATIALASPVGAQLLNHKDLSLATALAIATTAGETCKGQGYRVSVTVVGRTGEVVVQLRGDDASPHTIENSQRKAYTARTFRAATADVADRLQKNPRPSALHLTGISIDGGGLPAKIGEDVIGAVGVSGSPGGDKDEACAKAGLDKVADQLK